VRTWQPRLSVRADHPDRDDVWQGESLEVVLDAAGRPVVRAAVAVAA
jgi:hypothetical protein